MLEISKILINTSQKVHSLGKLDVLGSYWRPWFSSDNPWSRVSLAVFKTSTEVSSCMLSSSLERHDEEKHLVLDQTLRPIKRQKQGTLIVKDWPVVVQNPHEDVVHPLPANRWRMRDESRHGAQELLELSRRQASRHFMDDVQTHSLRRFISSTEKNIWGGLCFQPKVAQTGSGVRLTCGPASE